MLELCVVVLIIGMIMATALPQLMPLLVFSELDAQARRLAQYGSGVVAEAALFGTEITVFVDLDAQEYYAVRLVYPEEEEDTVDQMALFSNIRNSGEYSSQELSSMLRDAEDRRLSAEMPEDFDADAADTQMSDRFNKRHYQLLYARAQNVKHDAGILSEIGPLFESEFTLSWAEPYEEELADSILQRHKLPEGIRITSVHVEGSSSSRGLVEIAVSPLGLSNHVALELQNDDGDYFTITWNPLTGRGLALQGR